jgi:hypothetical protein
MDSTKTLLGKLTEWFVDMYLSDVFVPREDFDHVQNREFPIIQRDLEALRAHRDSLLRENHKLICLGLHKHAFLPKCEADDGQVDIAVTTFRVRESFSTRVCVEVSDDCRRAVAGPLRPGVFDYLAKMLAEHIKRNLIRKFEPKFPRKRNE